MVNRLGVKSHERSWWGNVSAQPPCGPPHLADSSGRAHSGSEANIRYSGRYVHPYPRTKHMYNVDAHLPSKLRHPSKHTHRGSIASLWLAGRGGTKRATHMLGRGGTKRAAHLLGRVRGHCWAEAWGVLRSSTMNGPRSISLQDLYSFWPMVETFFSGTTRTHSVSTSIQQLNVVLQYVKLGTSTYWGHAHFI
jgi:hypothetical protein